MKKILIIGLLAFYTSTFAQTNEKPNIILIAVDDLNDWIGVYDGNSQIKTPNIDKLAENAMVFRNASCSGPVCGPSRSALLSGFMPGKTGIYGNGNNMLDSKLVQENATLPEYFSKNGYTTISKGKIFHKHITENGVDHGQWAFDIWEQEKGNDKINTNKLYSRNKGIINGKKIPDAKYTKGKGTQFSWAPTIEAKEETKDYNTAEWFAGKLKDDYEKPFFMAVGISKPHLPWFVPQEYFDMYGLDSLKIPEYRDDDYDDILDKNGKKIFKPSVDFLWAKQDKELFKRAVRAYMASVSYADDCVGVVMDALRKSKYAENTIVILIGDHGWHLGEKLRFRKAELWKESTQTPFILHVPGMSKMQYCNRNVNLIDIYPTLIDLAKLPAKSNLDGVSISPLIKDPTKTWYPTLTTDGEGDHSVMSEDWHYIIRSRNGGLEELYNLTEDPMEWNNLANSKSKEVQKMKQYLKTFVPKNDAKRIQNSGKDKSIKYLDNTIKSRRILSKLK
ncbi:sulfatase [Polaribacter sp. Hel_I_88]|uniref:sulfatase n=1 Tax=Polaribacter sp. Hel_I_88 TaxID=1250006 RepID=UPI0009E07F2E|nr:sulfatase [Polaribacter sp. Hel_I_88]